MPKDKARKVVNESLHTFLCVDDAIVPPYGEPEEGDTKFSREMFSSFFAAQKQLKLYHFQGEQADIDKVKKHFSGVDILILDWQLEGDSFDDALKILAEAIKYDDIKHIFIYTAIVDAKGQGTEKVMQPIFRAFTKTNITEKQLAEIEECLEEILEETEIDLERIIADISSDVWQDINNGQDPSGRLIKIIMATVKKEKRREFIEKKSEYGVLLSDWILEEVFKRTAETRSVEFINSFNLRLTGINSLLADFKPIHIIGKTEAKNEQLMGRISDSIIEDPNSYFGLLNYEVLQIFKKKFFKRAKEIAQVDDRTVKKHCNFHNACSSELPLESLVKNVYKEAFSSIFSHNRPELIDYAETYFKNVNDPIPDEKQELMYINHITSTNLSKEHSAINDPKIEFGDIFKIDGLSDYKYAICITPHCDCLRPHKVDGQYLFVLSRKADGKGGANLEKLDGKFISFVYDGDYKIVDWREDPSDPASFVKPKTLYIDAEHNDITKPICALFNKDFFTMTFIGQQKESFTQRLANEAARYPMRVGVDYISLAEGSHE